MSENNQINNNNEEVDLGQLFKAIGQVFDRFINVISSIFKGIFSTLIIIARALIDNFKLIVIAIIIIIL